MHEVIRDPERVERPLSHLVEIEVVALLGVRVLCQAKNLDASRPHRVVDNAIQRADLVKIVQLMDIHD